MRIIEFTDSNIDEVANFIAEKNEIIGKFHDGKKWYKILYRRIGGDIQATKTGDVIIKGIVNCTPMCALDYANLVSHLSVSSREC